MVGEVLAESPEPLGRRQRHRRSRYPHNSRARGARDPLLPYLRPLQIAQQQLLPRIEEGRPYLVRAPRDIARRLRCRGQPPHGVSKGRGKQVEAEGLE